MQNYFQNSEADPQNKIKINNRRDNPKHKRFY